MPNRIASPWRTATSARHESDQPLKQLPMPGQTVQAFCQKVGMAMAKVELRF